MSDKIGAANVEELEMSVSEIEDGEAELSVGSRRGRKHQGRGGVQTVERHPDAAKGGAKHVALMCENSDPGLEREVTSEHSARPSSTVEPSHEPVPTSSPPPYPTLPTSTAQLEEESDATAPSPSEASSPLLQQSTPTPSAVPHVHRNLQSARDRIKSSHYSGVRSRRRNDPASIALKDNANTIKLLNMRIRALEAEKSAGVAQQQIETLQETIRANKAEEEVRVMRTRVCAMRAEESTRLKAREEVAQAKLEAEALVEAAQKETQEARERTVSAYGRQVVACGQKKAFSFGEKLVTEKGMRMLTGSGSAGRRV